jgi:hypothetical protein
LYAPLMASKRPQFLQGPFHHSPERRPETSSRQTLQKMPPLQVSAGRFFRLECDHDQLFCPEYKRCVRCNTQRGCQIPARATTVKIQETVD